jgi:orotidine-5'-phosphate decarboxylase
MGAKRFRRNRELATGPAPCYILGPMTGLRRPALFCAFDTPDLAIAESLGQRLAGAVDGVKLGLEFFTAQGPDGVRKLQRLGLPVFLDLKLHDIPNTVEGAARAASVLGVQILTVHGSGGRAMLEAALAGARAGAAEAGVAPPSIVAISVLTSLGEAELAEVGQAPPVAAQAERLALLARAAGLAGIVGSAAEVANFRRLLGPQALLVVPGIRPAAAEIGDQKRVATPGDAVRRGADVLVVGRPITSAADPAAAARAIRQEMDQALAGATS